MYIDKSSGPFEGTRTDLTIIFSYYFPKWKNPFLVGQGSYRACPVAGAADHGPEGSFIQILAVPDQSSGFLLSQCPMAQVHHADYDPSTHPPGLPGIFKKDIFPASFLCFFKGILEAAFSTATKNHRIH